MASAAVLEGNLAAITQLGEIDPDFENALKSKGPSGPEVHMDIRAIREAHEREEVELAPPLPKSSPICESVLRIPLRDGYGAAAILVRPKVQPPGGSPLAVIFFGGGYFVGTPKQQLPLARSVAERYGAAVLLPEYRLAPEHVFPTPMLDAWDVTRWAASHATQLSADPSLGFVLGGLSAGGQLANICAHLAKEEALAPPVTGMWLNITRAVDEPAVPTKYKGQFVSMEQCHRAPLFDGEALAMIDSMFKPDHASPWSSSFNRSSGLQGLPRTYISVCGMDPFRDGGLILERELRSWGVETKLAVYPGVSHGFWIHFPQLEVAKRVVREGIEGLGWLLRQEGS